MNSKGVGRSLGYGFVEFTTHEAALAALRATNNNPKTFGEKRVRLLAGSVNRTFNLACVCVHAHTHTHTHTAVDSGVCC